MLSENKKYLVGFVLAIGLFWIGSKYRRINTDPVRIIQRQAMVQILKKAKKENYCLLKKVVFAVSKFKAERNVDLKTQAGMKELKQYIESKKCSIKTLETFEKNYTQVSLQYGYSYTQFKASVDFYIESNELEVRDIIDCINSDYKQSLSGKLPKIPVKLPETLTKQKFLSVHNKLTLKKYLMEIQIYRKIRIKNSKQLSINLEQEESMPSFEEQEQELLEEEGLGTAQQPAMSVYNEAMQRYQRDQEFQASLDKISLRYMQIIKKYQQKMQNNIITQDQLKELEDQLIYQDPI